MRELKPEQKSKFFLLAIILAAFSVSSLPVLSMAAESADVTDLNVQKNEKQRALLEIQAKLSELQKQINQQRGKIASLSNELSLYDLQIQQMEQRIAELNAQIDLSNTEIIEVLAEIQLTEKQTNEKKQVLTGLLREIYEADQISPLQLVLQQNNFSELLNHFQNTVAYQAKTGELVSELQQLKRELDDKQAALTKRKKELEDLKGQALLSEQNLLSERKQRQVLLATTRGQESRYKLLLNEVSEEEAKISREIFNLDLEIREKLGDKSLPPVTGAMSWPMEGILTQGYGNTGFTKLGYTFHNGIDIAAPPNTPIHAAADGVVYAAGSGRAAYGNWVVLRHALQTPDGSIKNVMTLYAHLSRISVTPGQGILRGDTVGLEGNSGNTTALLYGPERGYHLHFTVFDEEDFNIKDGAYTDVYGPYQIPYGYTYNPMQFLK